MLLHWAAWYRDLLFDFPRTFPSPWIIFLAADEIGYKSMLASVLTEWGQPLPCLWNTDDVWSIFCSNILTAVRDHCLFRNSCEILLAPYPFSSCKSFIAALSSFVNGIVNVYVCSLLTSLLTSLCSLSNQHNCELMPHRNNTNKVSLCSQLQINNCN